MPLSTNRLRSFKAASGHQCSKGAAAELDFLQAHISQRIRLLDRNARTEHATPSPGVSSTEARRRAFPSVAGGLALLTRNLADDLKSSAPMFEFRCHAGDP